MATEYNPRIVTDNLVFYVDAGNTKSYPGTGDTWTDMSGVNNGTLTNGPTFNSDNGGSIVFDGDEAGQKASWRTVENSMSLLREDTRISFIFLKEGEDPDSYIKENGKEAFYGIAKNSKSLSDYFFETIKNRDDLSNIEVRFSKSKSDVSILILIISIRRELIFPIFD